jgi:hypothetical protein
MMSTAIGANGSTFDLRDVVHSNLSVRHVQWLRRYETSQAALQHFHRHESPRPKMGDSTAPLTSNCPYDHPHDAPTPSSPNNSFTKRLRTLRAAHASLKAAVQECASELHAHSLAPEWLQGAESCESPDLGAAQLVAMRLSSASCARRLTSQVKNSAASDAPQTRTTVLHASLVEAAYALQRAADHVCARCSAGDEPRQWLPAARAALRLAAARQHLRSHAGCAALPLSAVLCLTQALFIFMHDL